MNILYTPETNPFEIAGHAAQQYRTLSQTGNHDIALTLGSGWGKAAETIGETIFQTEASTITGFKSSQVPGHNSSLSTILLEDGRKVFLIGARTHFYESHNPYHVRAVVHSVRTASALGCKTLFMTNGAGSINPEWKPGTVVTIKDHINLTGTSPIEGANFIDLTNLYDPEIRQHIKMLYPQTPEGVYVQNRGPQYETAAEVDMAERIGGELVGMSTALEAIAGRQLNMNIAAMTLVTNFAAGTTTNLPLNHAEVLETGKENEERLSHMLAEIINTLPAE